MVDGPNVYAYVKGNPATFIDYDGSFTLIELCIAICILGVLVFIGGCMFKGCKKSGMTNQEILSAILDVAGMPVNNIPVPPPGAARILLKSEWTRLWRLHECATYPDKPVCKRLAEYGKMLGVNVQSRCE